MDEGTDIVRRLHGDVTSEKRPGTLQVDVRPARLDPTRWERFKAAFLRVVFGRQAVELADSAFEGAKERLGGAAVKSREAEARIEKILADARKVDIDTELSVRKFAAESEDAVVSRLEKLRELGFDARPILKDGRVVGLEIADTLTKLPSETKD